MAKKEYNIYQVDPESFDRFRELSSNDTDLLISSEITRGFDSTKDFIELSFYNSQNYKVSTINSFTNFSILTGDTKQGEIGASELSLDVQGDYLDNGFDGEDVKLVYSFLNNPFSSILNLTVSDFYVESISADRTELRLVGLNLIDSDLENVSTELNQRFNEGTYVPDLYINFGPYSPFFRVINVDQEPFRDTVGVLIKLYQPLPTSVGVKSKVNVVEKIADSVAYEVETTIIPEKEKIPYLRGANFSVPVEIQTTEPSQYFNYTELFSFPTNNSNRELNSLFNEKGAELGLDYSDFSNFINFSSAEERVRNFKYKLDLIESYQTSLDNVNTTGNLYTNVGISGSMSHYKNLLDGVINNFDHYERHLYFESGSTSWPKTNSNKPYINQLSSTTEATDWYISEVNQAIEYDATNPDLLANSIPSFLREDPNNVPYDLFIDMIGQHFDNLWIYTDSVSKKYDADNRLNKGVSKDLVEDLLKNFGIKLYTSTKSTEDLFRYFTKNTYDFNEEQNLNIIDSGEQQLSQNDYQKEIYKRIYHNLPTLLKSKGTERGLRALINCFGIPSDVLKIRIFGGQSIHDTPYFGGEQAFSSSLDKVRLSNTGSIVEGDTISFFTSIVETDNKVSQDLHRVEVGFSPSNTIDNYIVSQSQVLFPNNDFNIDQYIGDPRGYPTNKYTDLVAYSKVILSNVDAYNVRDFVRFIKFFDNVLFRMVRDFIPARNVTDAGVIIKPHILDRNKAKAPTVVWTRPEYTGSIDTAFISGSNAGAYKSVAAKAFRGESRTGNPVEGIRVMTPYGPRRREVHNIPASDIALPDGSFGKLYARTFGEPKFDGELPNSTIRISDGELNDGNPFKQIDYPQITYDVQFWSEIPTDVCIIRTGSGDFIVSNPLENVDLINSNIFIGDSPVYSYEVENAPPNISSFVHNFSLDEVPQQYDTFEVQATHEDHPNISNLNFSPPQAGCQETRTIRIVECRINEGNVIGHNVPSPLTVAVNYNLFDIFFPPLDDLTNHPNNPALTNTHLTFFVNDVEVGSTIDGIDDPNANVYQTDNGTVNIFNFTYLQSEGNQFIRLRVSDTFDPSCSISLTVAFDICTLRDIHADIQGNPGRTDVVPLQLATGLALFSSGTTEYYLYPFSFTGVTDTTAYFFRVRVRLRAETGPTRDGNYEIDELFGPVPGEMIVDPQGGTSPVWNSYFEPIIVDPDDIGTFNPLSVAPSSVPAQFAEILIRYPHFHDMFYQDASGLGLPAVGTNYRGIIVTEGMFHREIQFKAVTDENCSLESRWYDLPGADLEKRKVTFLRHASSTFIPGDGAEITVVCLADTEIDVWVRVENTYLDGGAVPPHQVLDERLTIYANDIPNDFTHAPTNIYGYLQSNDEIKAGRWVRQQHNGYGSWLQSPGNTDTSDPPNGFVNSFNTGPNDTDDAFSSIISSTLHGITSCGGFATDDGGGTGFTDADEDYDFDPDNGLYGPGTENPGTPKT